MIMDLLTEIYLNAEALIQGTNMILFILTQAMKGAIQLLFK